MLIVFRERGRKGERHECERENIGRLPLVYIPTRPGTEPAPQAIALTGNQTRDLSIYGMMLEPSEPYWLGLTVDESLK